MTVRSRALWTFAGQGLSSASNFLLTVVVLAVATPGEFGTFAVGLTTFLLCAQLGRYALGMPVMVLYSASRSAGPGEWRRPVGLSLTLGAVVGSGLIGAAALFGNTLPGGRATLGVLGLFLPMLLLQDTLRFVAFAAGRPSLAAASDGSWIVLQALGFLALAGSGHRSVAALLAVWGAAAAAAAVGSAIALGAPPELRGGNGWLRTHRVLVRRLAVEFVLTSGSYYALNYGLVALAGATELGRLRAAQTLFGPISVLLLGGTSLGVPEGVRARHDAPRLRRVCGRLSIGLAAVALLSGAAVYLAVPLLGDRPFSRDWLSARSIIPALSVFGAAVGASTGAVAGLRSAGETAWIVRGRGASGGLSLVVGLPGCWVFGANGMLGALALAEWALAYRAWRKLELVLGEPSRAAVATGVGLE